MNKLKYKIGDKVMLITHDASIVYTVYAITNYYDRYAYTIWNGDDYITCDEWQIEPYVEIPSIGFTITEDNADSKKIDK